MAFRSDDQDPSINNFENDAVANRDHSSKHHYHYYDECYMKMPYKMYPMSCCQMFCCPYIHTCPKKETCPIALEYKKMFGFTEEELKIMPQYYRDDPDDSDDYDDPDPYYRPYHRPYYRPYMYYPYYPYYHPYYHHYYYHHHR